MKGSLMHNCLGLMQTNADSITNSGSKIKTKELNKSIDELLAVKPQHPQIPHPKKKKRTISSIHTLDTDIRPANISIEDFIARSKDFEHKRNLDLETKRIETLNKEKSYMQDRPTINTKSLQYASSHTTKPLYTRVKEEINKKKVALENFKLTIEADNKKKEQVLMKDMPQIKVKGKEADERIKTWVNKQFEYINITTQRKKKEEESALVLDKKEFSFRPEISSYSKQIARRKQKKADSRESNLIYNRLYSQRNEKYETRECISKEELPSFTPTIHYTLKSKDIHSKYNPNVSLEGKSVKKSQKKPHSIDNKGPSLEPTHNSIDLNLPSSLKPNAHTRTNSNYNTKTHIDDINTSNELPRPQEGAIDHWSTVLLKMSQGSTKHLISNPPDYKALAYKLNIRQNGAWNDLTENQVSYHKAKGILALLLD